MKIRTVLLVVPLALYLVPMPAPATEPGFYLGGKLGAASTDEEWIDDDDSSFGAYFGYRFTPYFGLEAEYTDFGNLEVDLGDLDISNPRVEPRAWGLRAMGFMPVSERVELLAGAGMHSFDLDPSDDEGFRDLVGSRSSTDLMYGVGAQFTFENGLGLRAQYQRYEFKRAGRSDEVSLGLHYNF